MKEPYERDLRESGSTGGRELGDLIPVLRTIHEEESLAARAALDAAGIPAFCFDNSQSTLRWDISVIQPRVVYVARADLDAARAVVEDWTPASPAEVHSPDYAEDSSPRLRRRQRRARLGMWLVAIAFIGSMLAGLLGGLVRFAMQTFG